MYIHVSWHEAVCTNIRAGTDRGQKRALYPLELELQLVVSCHVGAGN